MSLASTTRSEFTKISSTSVWWILAIVLVVYVGGTAAAMAGLFGAIISGVLPEEAGQTGAVPPNDALAPMIYSLGTTFGYVFPLLVGTLMATGEFRHKTLTPTFLATPRRGVVLTAKTIAAAVIGVFFGVVALLSSAGAGAALLAVFGVDTQLGESDTWAMFGRSLIAFALWAVIGLGLGALIRNQVAAIVIVLAFTQFIEPILRLAGGFVDTLAGITDVLPGAASDALVGSSFYTAAAGGSSSGLEWWGGALVLAGYAVVLLVISALTSWRRDVT